MNNGSAELSRIASTIELSDGLALILVVGPDFRAPEGLELIRSSLPASRPTFWHRLDHDGPDVVSAVERAQMDAPIVLVHGLENLEQDGRASTESSLNMLRDRLALIRAAVILWVPRSELESFQRHCADLFAWRSLLVSLSEEQVRIDPDLEARRIYLFQLRTGLRQRIAAALAPLQVRPEVLGDRMVRPKGAQFTVRLSDWVKKTQYGLLRGGAGSGKTTALMALALLWASEAADTPPSAPCPLFVTAGDLYRGPAFGLDLDGDEMPVMPFPGARFGAWARAGDLVLMLDGLDGIEKTTRELFADWLEQLRNRYPRLRMAVTGRHSFKELRSSWSEATLEPISFAKLRTHLAQLAQPSERAMLDATLGEMEALQKSRADALALPWELVIRLGYEGGLVMTSLLTGTPLVGSLPSSLAAAGAMLISLALQGRGGGRAPSPLMYSDPQVLKRLLSFLAFRGLMQGNEEVLDEGIAHALTSMRRETDDSLPEPDLPENPSALLHEVARYLPWIVTETGPHRFRFAHPLFQIFFASDWVANEEPGAAARLLAPVLDQHQWRMVAIMASGQFAKRNPREAHEFIDRLLRVSIAPGTAQLRLLALALDCALAARLPAQDTSEWRTQAGQLCRAATHSREEEAARKELCDALDRLSGWKRPPT